MQIYFIVFSMCSILYYVLIAVYTRKWNSTFAGFWILCGALHLLMAAGYPLLTESGRKLTAAILAVCWLVFLVVELQIAGAMKHKTRHEVKYLIVLGAQVRGTRITNSLMRRLDCAYQYLMEHQGTIAVVSGGQGKGEAVSEADAMAENLIVRGIAPERILREDQSTSTWENLKFSAEYIGDITQPAALVTNNFHVFRSLLIGKQVGYTCLEGIAATSNPVLFVNYMVREFFAVLLTKIKSMI